MMINPIFCRSRQIKCILVGFGLAFLSFIATYGQTVRIKESDVYKEIWAEATAKLKITDKWRTEFTQSSRFRNGTGYKFSFSELGIQYKFTDALALKIKGRYTLLPDTNDFFKYYADLSYGLKWKGFPLKVDYRMRFENSPATSVYPREAEIRNRIGISYNLSKFADPYFQYELFYCIKGDVPNKFSDHRYYAGIQWTLGKRIALNTGYFFDQEIQEIAGFTSKGNPKITMPDRLHTLLIELEYEF
jgi:hypothetical protein